MRIFIYSNKLLLPLLLSLLYANTLQGQIIGNKDSIAFSKLQIKKSKFFNNIFQQAINSKRRSPPDPGFYGERSKAPYLPYQGKIIRHIDVRTLSFNRSFKDTGERERTEAIKLAERFH